MKQEDWNIVLDADPANELTRLVYADWLEDQGQEQAAQAQRWIVTHKKYPLLGNPTYSVWKYHNIHTCYEWWLLEQLPKGAFEISPRTDAGLPATIFKHLADNSRSGTNAPATFREYYNRLEAEAALEQALVLAGEIKEQA